MRNSRLFLKLLAFSIVFCTALVTIILYAAVPSSGPHAGKFIRSERQSKLSEKVTHHSHKLETSSEIPTSGKKLKTTLHEFCRHTYNGKTTLADDQGNVCTWTSLHWPSGCCTNPALSMPKDEKQICATCNSSLQCCSTYSNCVACCQLTRVKDSKKQSKKEFTNSTNLEVWYQVSNVFGINVVDSPADDARVVGKLHFGEKVQVIASRNNSRRELTDPPQKWSQLNLIELKSTTLVKSVQYWIKDCCKADGTAHVHLLSDLNLETKATQSTERNPNEFCTSAADVFDRCRCFCR